MPLTRYQIRNEYSLADPELYRAADRDDPEALLEGVAMAGLVGVLRQLGDLAEFAAEIFHDLHEEVMATAARGHGLTIRVQQLEAEFPSIEKEFLSQTSHSQFLYKPGIDWHPNMRMDQSIITQGDLPRFVMDSYEECRGPPRLFLLDKFDIAGAGACLKRYSDPSFFKVELTSSETTKAEVQKDKKARKFKKKGSRWRNGETPEVFAASSAKLHQLFSEERSQTGNNVPSLRVRLKKRQLNESFDSTTRKSYMEKFLETEREVVCESFVSPPRLKTASSSTIELDLEIPEISPESPVNKLLQTERSPDPSPRKQESVLKPSTDELRDDDVEGGTFEKLPEPNPENEVEKIPFTFYKAEDQKESAVDGERKTEASTDGYRSDDITSEVDNYMDALATMESEMETDTECGSKNEQAFFNIERQGVDSKELQAQFSDSHSIGNSSASDDGNNSFKKGRSSFSYSDTLSNLAENVPSDGDVADQADPCTEISPVEIVDMSINKLSRNGDNLGTKSPKCVIPEGTCHEVSEIPSYRSEFGEPYSNSCITESTSTPHLSPVASLSVVQLAGAGLIKVSDCMKAGIVKSSNCEDDLNFGDDLPCATNVSDCLPTGTAGRQPVKELDEGIPDVSSEAQMYPSMEISPVEIVDISFYKLSRNGDDLGTTSPKHVIPKGTFHEVSEIPSYRSEFGEADLNSCITDSTSTPSHLSPGASLSGVQLAGPGSIEVSSCCLKASIMKSSNGEDDPILGGDLPCTTNVPIFSAKMKDDFLPTGTAESQPVEELDGGTPDVSSDALLHLSNNSDLALQRKNNNDALGEVFPSEYAEDSSSMEKVLNGKLDTLHSVTFTTGKIHGLAERGLETSPDHITSPPEGLPASTTPCDLDDVKPESVVAEMDNVTPSTGEKFEYLKTVTDSLVTGDAAEHDFPEMTDEVQATEFELDSAEVDIPCSEVNMFNHLEVSSNTSDCEKKDKSTPDMVHLNSLASVGSDAVSLELPPDCSEPTSVTEVHSQLDDLITGTIQAEAAAAAAAADDTSLRSNVICSPSRNHLKLQEECLSSFGDLPQKKMEIKKASSPEYLMESEAQKEVNQVAVAPTDLNFVLCSAESRDPFSSKLLDDVRDSSLGEKHQNDLHLSDCTVAPTSSKECDQESESKSPCPSHLSESAQDAKSSSTQSLLGPGIPVEQALELQADQFNVESLHEDGESSKSSILKSEETQFLNHTDQIGYIDAPSKSCPADPLSQPSESEFSPLPRSHNIESFETAMDPLDSISPSVGLLPQATHQHLLEPLPGRPVCDFLLPDPNAIQVNLEEMPPLPPLPPMQWRIGKLQHGSLASEGEMMQPSLNPFSPLQPDTEDKKAQLDFSTIEGESAQPLNPFLPLSDIEDEKLGHYSEILGGEMVQHSLNPFLPQVPTMVDDEISQQDFLTLDGKITEPLNPFLTLPAIDDERLEHGSRTLGGELVQPTLNPHAPLPTSEYVNIRNHSLSLQGKLAQPLNPSAASRGIEDENLQHTSTNLEREMENPPFSFAPPLTREDELPRHGSLTLEGESAWSSNPYALLLAVEDGNPNGNRHMKHPRPRDPLIEAVASHDKSTLRKVREQDQPLTRLKVDERDSLLEQIRAKSFNLKPAVVARPNIHGPQTNLKVAAILEKANAIRQALAGSDEDDDGDSWSDS
ncbi:hypothetical protein HHK36_010629 [Tetracentron sinense]|uniref:Protein SCAR n=1 Tax=Tetracentron sinense TaxID=13715 RepID=A0A835DJQ8_TETSI|nr:hypothetical protein HHK36_010629 [Tetracentron sinense]